MATLWDILTGKQKKEKPEELKVVNPLGLTIGQVGHINTLDLDQLDFKVKAIRNTERRENGRTHTFTDYDLSARDLEGKLYEVRLRLVPMEDPDGDLTHSAILLQLYDEFEFNDDFRAKLDVKIDPNNPDAPHLQNDTDGSQWWRVNNILTPWEATTETLSDEDHSGKVDPNEIRRGKLTYWDYWRHDNNANREEFLIVELNHNHMFRIYTGPATDPHLVDFVE